MRAIDADGVSEILTRVIEEQKKSHHVDEVIGLMEARTEVNNAPTLDVKPVVHAHVVWAKPNISYQTQCCSNCHRTFISRPDETIQFCPHCGARMDEDKYWQMPQPEPYRGEI